MTKKIFYLQCIRKRYKMVKVIKKGSSYMHKTNLLRFFMDNYSFFTTKLTLFRKNDNCTAECFPPLPAFSFCRPLGCSCVNFISAICFAMSVLFDFDYGSHFSPASLTASAALANRPLLSHRSAFSTIRISGAYSSIIASNSSA